MKRIVSYLLITVLILAPCLQTSAAEIGSVKEESSTTVEEEKVDSTDTEEIEKDKQKEQPNSVNAGDFKEASDELKSGRSAEVKNSGQVDVYITPALAMGKNTTFEISLTGQTSKNITVEADLEKAEHKGVTFENLAAGTYTLTVTAPGFAAYTQQIEVQDWAYIVRLTTGFVEGYDYKGNVHPGVLLVGDVDKDGGIEDDDKDYIISELDGTSTGKYTDLNQDGKIDLVDLEYFTKGYQTEASESSVETSVPASVLETKSGAGTKVEGNLDNLSKSEGVIKLSREDGDAISSEKPVVLEFDLKEEEAFPVRGIVIDTNSENPIKSAGIEITYIEEGKEKTLTVPIEEGIDFLMKREAVHVSQDGAGAISIDFGSQIAIKKVTIMIKGMQKNNNLAEISRVEFVNNMEERIPQPEMNIPENLSVQNGNKEFTVTWDSCQNVTGYEVQIENGGKQEVIAVKGNLLKVTSFGGKELVNNKNYTVKVQAVNGAWRSGYSKAVTATPKASTVPEPPDNVTAAGKYRAVDLTWKNMEDTDTYNLYYKEVDAQEYTKIEKIAANKYTVSDLKDRTSYEFYVTGVNDLGESKPSLKVKADTTDINPANMTKYKLLNSAEEGKVSSHIINVTTAKGEMKDSPLDTSARTAWGTVDNNAASYYFLNSWDSGGFNPLNNNGVTYEFDQPYKMQMFSFQEVTVQGTGYGYVRVRYWDESGKSYEISRDQISVQQKRDSEGRVYYMVKLPQAVTAKKLQFGVGRSLATGTTTLSEVYFYHYDSIEDDIMALYEDDLHTVLREDVTQDTIDELRVRINTKDEASGEYHPEKDRLERELKTAEDILNSVLSESVRVYNTITTSDKNRGFGGLNAWQPLGITAAAGERITIYVGHNTKKTGENTNLQLVATQYHAESSSMFKVIGTLKIGKNEVTIPKIWSTDAESGGALYVQYTGNNAYDNYAVRVSGGVEVPKLDLYQVSDQAVKLERAEKYITELDRYVKQIEEKHNECHKNSDNKLVQYDYKKNDCILGASDILLNTMMLSLPAQQIVAGTGSGSTQERAQKLVNSMDAMEKMMTLFYQHKGLNNNATDAIDKFPSSHLNIRYQRMFAGAFMYASGNHIGIEWSETAGMMNGVPVQSDEAGRYESGQYFGWGIAHEIGHCINQSSYDVAEITNNYFAVLAQAKDRNDSVRFSYDEVYKKVTSGTKGRSSNVFTQLGLYWQLHLAYDNGYNYKTYEQHSDQLQNLFFARVDTYARTPSKAPAPDGVALTLSGDKDQNLMRLACAAAQKDNLEFFERWGMTADDTTKQYAAQFEKETRAIYYGNDDSRVYRLENGGSSLGTNGDVEAVGDNSSVSVNPNAANQVDFLLTSKGIAENDVLGYEIVRCTTSNGEIEREVVGFTTGNTFSDHITTLNNRVVSYEVTVIDQYLNRSAVKTLGPLKIEHEGNIDKSFWSVTTNDLTATNVEAPGDADENTPCGPEAEAPIKKAVDNDGNTAYTGTVGDNAEVVLEFNRTNKVTGFKYTVNEGTSISDYSIYIRNDQNEWVEAAGGTFTGDKVQTVYFGKKNSGNIAVYQTSAVKLAVKSTKGTEIAISEIDVLGVTGDNVDFRRTAEGTAAIGRLGSDYKYGDGENDVIPQGSIVFTGSYKGNPAYNVVLLYDQDGNIVGGTDGDGNLKASQTILADVPEQGEIQDVYDGTWIYWIEPGDQIDLSTIQKVRAELYRVDNALTNEGQRMVSDSLFEVMPETLPEIQLNGN